MSIHVNGSFEAGVVENEWPEIDYPAWSAALSCYITASGGVSRFFYARTRDSTNGYPGFAYNASSWDGIRCGNFGGDQAGYIPGTPGATGAVPLEFAADAVWARLIVFCDGVLPPSDPDYNASFPWRGRVRFAWIVLSETPRTFRTLPGSLLVDDCRLAGQYVPEAVFGFGGDTAADFDVTQFGLWSRALTSAEHLAQARTRTSLYPSDVIRYESLPDVASVPADDYNNGWIRTGTPTAGASDPAFPDDVVAGISPAAERVARRAEVGPTLAAGAVSVSVGFERVARRAEVGPSIASAGAIAAGFERVARRSEAGPTISSVSIGTPLSSAVIMFTGHSLLDQPIPDYVQVLAGSAGVSIDWNRQHVNGSTINNRGWNGGSNTGFLTGQNRDDASGLNLISHFRNVTAVSGKTTADPYTALVITQRHDTLNSLEWEATAQTLRQFYELVLQGSPGCLAYFYSSWFDYDVADLTDWIAYARETTTADAAIAGRINASLANESRSYRIRTIPASAALAELVEQATVGSVAGITQGTTQATLNVLFSDTVHPTPVGKYFLACVVYGAVYRRDPRGLGYPVTVTATQAASLQQIAWEVLIDTYGTAPHTGPDLSATAAKQAIVDYVPAYADFFPGTPINVPSYQAYWGGTSSVMHFDPPTTESIWLGLPLGAPAMGFERIARRSEVGPTITAATAGILAGVERVARRAEAGPTLTPGPVTISAGFERVARRSEVGPSVSSGSTTILPAAERIRRRAEVGPALTPGAVSLAVGAERVARRSELGPTLTPGTVALLAAVERVARRAEVGPTFTATSPGVAAGFERCLRASETGPTLTAGAVVLALAFERIRRRSEAGPTIEEQTLAPRDVIATLSWTHTPGTALAATWSPTQ